MRGLILAALALSGAAQAQTPVAPGTGDYPKRIPAPGGEVVLPSRGMERAYEEFHYAPARRAGDWVYVSGVVIGRGPGEGNDVPAFKLQLRRGFEALRRILAASGARFEEVVMVNSFHVWEGPDFTGTRMEQYQAFDAVKAEFMPAPHAAATAVGTTGLLAPGGIVEVQLIAYAPRN
jgi:enamine deaminase RidA (YjgF/YER057c/UK114 family)